MKNKKIYYFHGLNKTNTAFYLEIHSSPLIHESDMNSFCLEWVFYERLYRQSYNKIKMRFLF